MINIKKRLAVTLLFTLSFVELFAQGPGIPGGGDDGGNCGDIDADACVLPLDNWVIVLVIGGLIITTWHLHNKQKKEVMQ